MLKKFRKPIYVSNPILPDLMSIGKRLEKVWESGFITNNGLQVKLLEKKLARKLSVPYLSVFNNGTSALYTAIRYLGFSGEVITTPFTFASTPHTLTLNNIKPVFCDIDCHTLNIDPDKIEALITPRTTGILGVHVFGTPCDVKRIKQIADRYNLKVLYDAAHAFGSKVDGIGIGNYGNMSIFSFHATKLFHTAEGGGVVCRNLKMKQNIDILRNFGIKDSEHVIVPGLNGKMSEIHAALGLEVLKSLEEEITKRKKNLSIYFDRLSDIPGIILASKQNESLQYFPIRIDRETFGCSRDEVYDELARRNVYARKYFYPLCSDFPHYKERASSARKNFPVAKKIAKEILVLPFSGTLSKTDVNAICDIVINLKK